MSWPGELARRVRMLFGQRRWRRELAEEMRLHRELRGGGARRFGNELRLLERSQAQWGWTWLETWAQDIRHGLRLLRRTPLITALALVSLGLGIGATTALFTLTDAVLLRPLPVSHPEQLVELSNNIFAWPTGWYPFFSNPMWQRIQKQQGLFAGAVATYSYRDHLLVSGSYFPVLGIKPERGRLIGASDDYPGCPAVAVISDAFWHSKYGASAEAIGTAIPIANHSFEIIGVSPPSFFGTDVGTSFSYALPLCDEAFLGGRNSWLGARNGGFLRIFARLQPHEAVAGSQKRLNAARGRLVSALPGDDTAADRAAFRIRVRRATQGSSFLRTHEGSPLTILLGVAGLVWLLACANLAALMLAQTAARRPEIAMRAALGAGRARLIRQMLTESLLLAAGGSLLGWAMAVWACTAAVRFWSFPQNPLILNLQPDGRILAFAIGLTALTALLVGLAPALHVSDRRLALDARRGRPTRLLGWHLIAGQLALALVLVAGAGLFVRTLAQLTGPGKGFNANHVLLVRFDTVDTDTPAGPSVQAERMALLARLRALPGVAAASASDVVPTDGSSWNLDVWHPEAGSPHRKAFANAISPGYFSALRTPLLAGRTFSTSDHREAVAIINQSLATGLFPDGHAIGQTLGSATAFINSHPRVQIVGVVADAKYVNLRHAAPPTIYYPMQAQGYPMASFELRSSVDFGTVRREVRATLGAHTGAKLISLSDFMAARLKPERMLAWLAALFGGLALLLAGLGLYGVTAYSAARRRREFGIRVALGASESAIVGRVLREAVVALGAALGVGGVLAWLITAAAQAELGKLLYEISARDVGTWGAAALVLAIAALLAAWWPARQAARADAMAALREE